MAASRIRRRRRLSSNFQLAIREVVWPYAAQASRRTMCCPLAESHFRGFQVRQFVSPRAESTALGGTDLQRTLLAFVSQAPDVAVLSEAPHG